ncbi:hypothetical protein UA08_05213 [Talaromyces atroroseus]|uniref:FAD/NAD(P)-binding domain-containing protein n=1 Tax=Talaromyces atroroseus TaxID=1441469 RepID=A0A225AQS7_TALAT|nr:hypothetical protein UA08_05213 [Talaromyces atroroseus]OKL59608.1 hypothetical protein UA08_05213 [Talaromyces atroroseus]
MQETKTIVILGGSFSGVSIAHRILKQSAKTGSSVKIVLVSPNTHVYWSVATPRALIPGQFANDKLFQSITEGFKQYSSKHFEFVRGTAQSLDPAARKVGVSTSSGAQKTVEYDFLILATGSRNKDNDGGAIVPFKGLESTEATKAALQNIQAVVDKSKTIVISGAGPTGVETAGELAYEYGAKKKIILLTSGRTVLTTTTPSVSKTALGMLKDLKVEVKLETRVTTSTRTTRNGSDQVELSLSDGSKLTADLYIPTYGLVPNSSYIPGKYLNADGLVKVDEYFQVKGLENQHVWAIGDISDLESPQVLPADRQSIHLAKNIALILSNKPPVPYKEGSRALGLQIGKKTGTGHFGSFRIPGFIVTYLRKNLFVEQLGSMVNGSAY